MHAALIKAMITCSISIFLRSILILDAEKDGIEAFLYACSELSSCHCVFKTVL